MLFVYDGTMPGCESELRVCGKLFPAGVPIEATEFEAKKLGALSRFRRVEEQSEAVEVSGSHIVESEPQEALQSTHEPQEGQPKKRRGRPAGSKNKPKAVTDGDTNEG